MKIQLKVGDKLAVENPYSKYETVITRAGKRFCFTVLGSKLEIEQEEDRIRFFGEIPRSNKIELIK